MLVLSRKLNETLFLDVAPSTDPQRIVVTVCQINEYKIRLGIQADRKAVQIARGELVDQVNEGSK